MRVEGVRRAFDLVEGEGNADLGAEPHEMVVDRFQPPVPAEFPFHVICPVEPSLGYGRVKLVGRQRRTTGRDSSASAASRRFSPR